VANVTALKHPLHTFVAVACTQSEINEALLYATPAIDGTHAGLGTQR
jgi:hypothetical protein